MSSLSENWLAGFRVVDDGRTSVATYYWDAGSLSWVAGVQPGAGGGGLTNAELRASPVPVSLTSTTITGSVAVTGTFFQATQPISAASLPLPTGAATEATLATRLTESTYTTRHPVVGQALMAASMPVVIASNQSAVPVTLTSTTITGSVAVTGTVTANQGTANTAANGWFVRLTDATTNVAVKAASTAAAFTDGSLVVSVRPGEAMTTAGAALADAFANPTVGHSANDAFVFNGTSWDRQRGMGVATTTGDSGAKVATGNGATQTNVGNKGLQLFIVLGAVSGTTPTCTFKLQGSVDGGTNWYDIPGAATASLTASTNVGIAVFPGVAVTAGVVTTGTTAQASAALPRTWRVVWTIGGTTPSFAITSITYNYIPY